MKQCSEVEQQKNNLTKADLIEWNKMHQIVKALKEGKLILVRYRDGTKKLVNNYNYRW